MSIATTNSEGILLESGTNEVEFIEFYLGDVSYGINVSKVQRVLASSIVNVSQVADASPAVKGVIHIHDKPVMLMDLKDALGIPYDPNETNFERQLILVTTFNSCTTAFVIDGISKIHRTSWELFEPISEKITSDGSGGFSTGTINLDNNIIIILDLERLMMKYFPNSHSKSIDEVHIPYREGRENIRIVYAEDSRMVRNLTEDMLKKAGYVNILSFENGYEALEHLEKERGLALEEGTSLRERVDLVLTDIEMPRMDGLTLCRRVKKDLSVGQQAPSIIVYSSLINKEMRTKCQSVGADAQLAKPDLNQIVDLVDSFCID